MFTTHDQRQRILAIQALVHTHFVSGDWQALGLMTGFEEQIAGHDRLLRSLYFRDDDYSGASLTMLSHMVKADPRNLGVIEDYLAETYGALDLGGVGASSRPARGRRIYFMPTVFEVPEGEPDPKLISVMMPFTSALQPVYECISEVAKGYDLSSRRADDIWDHTVIIQDIFALIYRSYIVVCDFSGRNPNVFYEAGIAHTLGKHVIPIAQVLSDIPFDLQHHRAIIYLNNSEGRRDLQGAIAPRISHFVNIQRYAAMQNRG